MAFDRRCSSHQSRLSWVLFLSFLSSGADRTTILGFSKWLHRGRLTANVLAGFPSAAKPFVSILREQEAPSPSPIKTIDL
ncbi:hypothetical protein ACQKWADRAFT_300537 [Trichoderma austrokoningii]